MAQTPSGLPSKIALVPGDGIGKEVVAVGRRVLELSQRYNRRVMTVGRSLTNSIKIASQLGYLQFPPSLFADAGELMDGEPHQFTLLTTGSHNHNGDDPARARTETGRKIPWGE